MSTPRRRKLFVIAGAVLVVLLLCAGSMAVLFGKIWSEKGPVEAAVDRFMQAASQDDFEGAYACFCERAKGQYPFNDFEEAFSSSAYKVLTAGYQKAEVQNLNLTWTTSADTSQPQGQVAEVDGTLTYEGGYTGEFAAVLERERDEWRLYGINITAPPEKFEDYFATAGR